MRCVYQECRIFCSKTAVCAGFGREQQAEVPSHEANKEVEPTEPMNIGGLGHSMLLE